MNERIIIGSPEIEAKEKILREAEIQLALLGLELHDLEKYHKVLDLGAGLCYIERAAELMGQKNVSSAGLDRPQEISELKDLNFWQFNALRDWPFDRGAFDLVISRKGPLFLSETPEQAHSLLLKMANMAPKEIRINPVRFGYVKTAMFNENSEYRRINLKVRAERSPEERELWNEFNLEANKRTEKELKDMSFKFQILQSDSAGEPDIEADDKSFVLFGN